MAVLGQYMSDGAIRRLDGWVVPPNPDNSDYARLMAQVAAGDTITPYFKPLDETKAEKVSLVEADKEARISAGFTFGTPPILYQSRPEDRENLAGSSTAALAAMVGGAQPGNLRWHGGDADFQWIAADNSMTPMDAQTVFALGQAAMAHKKAHIFAAFAIKRAIEAATTAAEVAAIDINTGWPPNT